VFFCSIANRIFDVSHFSHTHIRSQTATLQPLLDSALLKIRVPLLNLMIERYEQCKSGHFQIVMLEGAEGTGKTHLAQAFLKWAATQTAAVFSGRAVIAEEHVPYHPLLDILQKWSNHEATIPHLPTLPRAGELIRLMPALAGHYPDLSSPLEDDEKTVRSHLAQAVATSGQTLHHWHCSHPLSMTGNNVPHRSYFCFVCAPISSSFAQHLPPGAPLCSSRHCQHPSSRSRR
jgi:hypothetical protein